MNSYERASYIMHLLHDGVKDSNYLPVSDQIQKIVDKIEKFYEGENKENIIIAGYLHKSFERDSIKPKFFEATKDLPFDFIKLKKLFGEETARIVFLLSTEPNDTPVNNSISEATTMDLAKQRWRRNNPNAKTNMSERELSFRAIALWASELPKTAQVILLAKKLQYFEVAKTKPNIKKPFPRLREEYKLQMYIVDALQEVCPAMHQECIKAKTDALKTLDILERSIIEEGKKLQQKKHL